MTMLAGKLAPKHCPYLILWGLRLLGLTCEDCIIYTAAQMLPYQHEELRFCLCADQLLVCCVQIINISSTLGSISTLQRSLDAEEGSFPATLSHYHLAYRSSKAALNMRKHPPTAPAVMPVRVSLAELWCLSGDNHYALLLPSLLWLL